MSQLLIIVVVVLLPGILATAIADKLTIHSSWDSFKFALYALVLGMLNYSLLQLLVYGWDVVVYAWGAVGTHHAWTARWTTLGVWTIAQNGNSNVASIEVVAATVLAIPLSFGVSACIHHKLLTRIGRWLHATSKYGDESLCSYFMSMKGSEWIYVRDKESNLTYKGRVVLHSETEQMHELVLQEVVVYRYEDSSRLYSAPLVYLSREMGKLVIESAYLELL
jgi:hypothetical protein